MNLAPPILELTYTCVCICTYTCISWQQALSTIMLQSEKTNDRCVTFKTVVNEADEMTLEKETGIGETILEGEYGVR